MIRRSRVGEKRYNILTNNCEHFCNWCIDGVSGTGQVTNATAQATAPVLGSAAAGAGMAAAGAGAFTAATGGAGMMSTLATVGSAVGGGAMAGIGVIGGAGGGLATIIANNTIFSDKPEDDASEKRRKDAGRVGTTIGAAAGTAGALTMVVTSAAAGTAGGAAITSGLAGIGAILGGGMVAGAATVVAAPAVIALGIGSLFYAIFD